MMMLTCLNQCWRCTEVVTYPVWWLYRTVTSMPLAAWFMNNCSLYNVTCNGYKRWIQTRREGYPHKHERLKQDIFQICTLKFVVSFLLYHYYFPLSPNLHYKFSRIKLLWSIVNEKSYHAPGRTLWSPPPPQAQIHKLSYLYQISSQNVSYTVSHLPTNHFRTN